MKWRGRRRSSNIEDRRGGGFSMPRMRRGGVRLGGRGRGGRGRRAGIGGIGLVVVVVVGLLFGLDLNQILGLLGGGGMGGSGMGGGSMGGYTSPAPSTSAPGAGGADPLRDFVAVVLADTEDVWNERFQRDLSERYREPRLVLFRDGVNSGCGFAQSAVGPFYCPADQKVYLDLEFFETLDRRLGAPGDFAQAYVIAHEVGHHVQTLLGISIKVRQAKARVGEAEANALSVRQELQADCFAGLWAHHAQRTKNILDPGDIDEALNAASAIGDDTLQRRSRGRVVPDSFTHGTSAQRQRWFRRGFDTGRLDACDTFNVNRL